MIDTLIKEKPAFQILSGNDDVPSSEKLLYETSALDTSKLKRTSAALPEKTLRYLDSILSSEQTTIEIVAVRVLFCLHRDSRNTTA